MSEQNLDQELQELEVEFADFGLEGDDFDVEDMDEFAELDVEVDAAGFDELGDEGGELSALGNDADVAFLGGFLKRKVAKLIRKLLRLVRRCRRCRKCARLLANAIRCFRRGRYACALRYAYRTYRCLRSCCR
ncbi:MAG: hypothetical protein ABFR65_06875 [Pseudomonadota bacterium]